MVEKVFNRMKGDDAVLDASKGCPHISVIVPFYNVSDCVGYCLRSLEMQTYRDFEVIAVDDGSTDGTATILDEYSGTIDIRVFHKENGGLSDARNFGVSKARGTYISFIDGDDFVSPYYLEFLQRAMHEADVEHVIAKPIRVMSPARDDPSFAWTDSFSYRKVNQEGLLRCYLRHDPEIASWAHLAHRDVYLHNPFEVGRRHEDMLALSDHVLCSREFAIIDNPLYGYVVRPGSITRAKRVTVDQIQDFKDALKSVELAIAPYQSGLSADIRSYRLVELSRLYRLSLSAELVLQDKEEIKHSVVRFARANFTSLLLDRHMNRGDKGRCVVLALIPSAYGRLFDLYERMSAMKWKSSDAAVNRGGDR